MRNFNKLSLTGILSNQNVSRISNIPLISEEPEHYKRLVSDDSRLQLFKNVIIT